MEWLTEQIALLVQNPYTTNEKLSLKTSPIRGGGRGGRGSHYSHYVSSIATLLQKSSTTAIFVLPTSSLQ